VVIVFSHNNLLRVFKVNFPNLELDKREIDFGCILNDTEVARFLDITNSSPLPVVYKWTFLVTEGEQNIRYCCSIVKTFHKFSFDVPIL